MNDSVVVSGLQGFGDLRGDVQSLIDRDRPFRDAFRQRWTLDQLHDEEVRSDIEEAADVVVIQRRNESGFTLEPLIETFCRNLDGHVTAEAFIASAIDFPHTTCADFLEDE